MIDRFHQFSRKLIHFSPCHFWTARLKWWKSSELVNIHCEPWLSSQNYRGYLITLIIFRYSVWFLQYPRGLSNLVLLISYACKLYTYDKSFITLIYRFSLFHFKERNSYTRILILIVYKFANDGIKLPISHST